LIFSELFNGLMIKVFSIVKEQKIKLSS